MGLSQHLAHAAVRRPHVLVVPVPGHRVVRWAAEDALDALGWPQACSPADADVLLCCGPPGEDLADHIEVAWQGLPGPRVRTTATTAQQVSAALAEAAACLADVTEQHRDARDRPPPRLGAADGPRVDGKGGGGHQPQHGMPAEGGPTAGGTGDGDGDMDMGMDLPGGLIMADRVEDRDGLRLEGLNLSLGPILPSWPAGLRLDVVLSGDVITRAEAVRLDPRPEPPAPSSLLALDALALLLDAAGWSDGGVRARRARAEGGSGPLTDSVLRRLRHARLLRWSLRGLPASGGDLVDHLDLLVSAVRGQAPLPVREDELPDAVVGLDVGTAALVVAAHGPLLPVTTRV